MIKNKDVVTALLRAEEPWVRYNTLRYLCNKSVNSSECRTVRDECTSHPLVKRLLNTALQWPDPPLKSHKTASHPIHHLALLAELGVSARHPDIQTIIDRIIKHQHAAGALQSVVTLPSMWGGSNTAEWLWMFCDTPVLLHACLSLGCKERHPAIRHAVSHLHAAVTQKRWVCFSSLEKLRGPGRKTDPCPYATLLALKAFSLVPSQIDTRLLQQGTAVLLDHWGNRKTAKLRMFGIGTDFRKLKYPFVFYDILHAAEVLSRFPWVWKDTRFAEMIACITAKRNCDGFYTPESVWMAFRGFDFAQKKAPSPMLTFIIERMLRRKPDTNKS